MVLHSTMRVAVMVGIGKVEIQERPIPVPKPGEALVRIKSVGICGSDVHYFLEGKIGDFVVNPPFILGHECAGEVVEVGKGVKKVRPGDRVALEPGIPCGNCKFCRSGRYNLCPDIAFWATPPVDGVFCEYVVHPEFLLYPLAQGVSFEEGALVEPFAVGVYAAQRANVKPGETVLILGGGPIGLLILQALRIQGVARVIVVDVFEFRLRKAWELGATAIINANEMPAQEEILDLTGGEGVDVVFEAAGSIMTTRIVTEVVRSGGKVVLVGFSPQTPLDISKIIVKELDVLGSWRYANVYEKATEFLNAGKVDLQSLITHRFSLEETEKALIFAHEHRMDSIKIVVDV